MRWLLRLVHARRVPLDHKGFFAVEQVVATLSMIVIITIVLPPGPPIRGSSSSTIGIAVGFLAHAERRRSAEGR